MVIGARWAWMGQGGRQIERGLDQTRCPSLPPALAWGQCWVQWHSTFDLCLVFLALVAETQGHPY